MIDYSSSSYHGLRVGIGLNISASDPRRITGTTCLWYPAMNKLHATLFDFSCLRFSQRVGKLLYSHAGIVGKSGPERASAAALMCMTTCFPGHACCFRSGFAHSAANLGRTRLGYQSLSLLHQRFISTLDRKDREHDARDLREILHSEALRTGRFSEVQASA